MFILSFRPGMLPLAASESSLILFYFFPWHSKKICWYNY